MQAVAVAAAPVQYDYARNSPNSAFSHMAVRDAGNNSWSRSSSATPFLPSRASRFSTDKTNNRDSNTPMDWEPLAGGPRTSRDSSSRRGQRSPSPADVSTNWRSGRSPSPFRLPRPSASNYEKRMSASLATQQVLSRRNSTKEEVSRGTVDDPAARESIEAELARNWAYTLGAELAHHVVGVFADPRSASYNKRWNSDMATRVFGSNPWGYLTSHKFFLPPFVCPEVVKRMPLRMQEINSAVRVVSGIVTTRNGGRSLYWNSRNFANWDRTVRFEHQNKETRYMQGCQCGVPIGGR